MKGIICYYSGSGNTRLACQYIAKQIKDATFDLFDIVEEKAQPAWGQYDLVGFATFVDFWGPPHLFLEFVTNLPQQIDKPAFIMATYGAIPGRTLKVMERAVCKRGFTIVAGHALHTPENYPPMIVGGRGFEHAPDGKELRQFNTSFITELGQITSDIAKGKTPVRKKIHIGFPNCLFPVPPRILSRISMGDKFVDESLCIECGICKKRCPYGAIDLDPKPIFDAQKCWGCWACYNHCPQKAIYTKRFKGVGHYSKPSAQLKEKLAI